MTRRHSETGIGESVQRYGSLDMRRAIPTKGSGSVATSVPRLIAGKLVHDQHKNYRK